jgi:uncharacterized membrane protein
MAFCASCGAPVDGRFCSKCGAAAGGPAAAGLTDNVAGALCYLLGFITGIAFLLISPYNQNRLIRFHAFQSIFLNLAAILCSFVLSIVFATLHIFGAFFGLLLGPLIWLAFFGLWLYLMFQAYQGRTVVLPIVGPLAQKQA